MTRGGCHQHVLLSGLLTVAGAAACGATVFGFLGRFSWLLDLFSHFRVQYLVGLAILGLVLLLVRRRKTATALFVFAGIDLAAVLPLYLGGRPVPAEATRTLRVMLLNVNTQTGDPQRVKQVMQRFAPDIIVLEEINSRWVGDLPWLITSHPHSRIQTREDNFGIGLFSKYPLNESEIVYVGPVEIPTILATVKIGQDELRVIATHPVPPIGAARSRWRNQQFERLARYTYSSLPLILLGDLNTTPWNDHFRKLLRRTGLIDSSKGYGVQPSWPSDMPLLRIPIDHCLHSRDIFVADRQIGPGVGSDHFPLIVDLVIRTRSDQKPTTKGTTTTKKRRYMK